MKKWKLLCFALISMFAITGGAKALSDTECITSEGTHKCSLSSDIEVTTTLAVQGDIELDVNGHVRRPA